MNESLLDLFQSDSKDAGPVWSAIFDGVAGGHDPHFRILLGCLVNDFTYAKLVEHAHDKTKMVQGLTPVGVLHGGLLLRGDSPECSRRAAKGGRNLPDTTWASALQD